MKAPCYIATLTDCNTGHYFKVVSKIGTTIESFNSYLLKTYGNYCNWTHLQESWVTSQQSTLSLTKIVKVVTRKHTNINKQAMTLAHALKCLYASKAFYRALSEAYKLLKSEAYLTAYTVKLEMLLQVVKLDSTKNILIRLLNRLTMLWFSLYIPCLTA
jgi:hypothetical protein